MVGLEDDIQVVEGGHRVEGKDVVDLDAAVRLPHRRHLRELHHPVVRVQVLGQQGGHGEAQAGGNLPDGGEGGRGLAALDLPQGGLGYAGLLGRLVQADAQLLPLGADDAADVQFR